MSRFQCMFNTLQTPTYILAQKFETIGSGTQIFRHTLISGIKDSAQVLARCPLFTKNETGVYSNYRLFRQ